MSIWHCSDVFEGEPAPLFSADEMRLLNSYEIRPDESPCQCIERAELVERIFAVASDVAEAATALTMLQVITEADAIRAIRSRKGQGRNE